MKENFRLRIDQDRLRFSGDFGTVTEIVLIDGPAAISRLALRRSGHEDLTIAVGENAAVERTFAAMADRWRPARVGSGTERLLRLLVAVGLDQGNRVMLLTLPWAMATMVAMMGLAMLLPDRLSLILPGQAALIAASGWVGFRIHRLSALVDVYRSFPGRSI